MIGVRGAERFELVGRARVFKAASGFEIREHHDLLGAENLRGVGHEFDPAKRDYISVSGGGFL